MEHKIAPSFGLKTVDEAAGIVEHVFTVFGVVDFGHDVSHPGSFAKTIKESGDKVLVLDAHKTDSVLDVIARPLEIREIGRAQLPPSVLKAYPEASGGVWARTQFLLDTPEGMGAFKRIKAGALHEWSYGYDITESDMGTVATKDGDEITVRNLRSIKLYEYSPVLWGMNPATATTAVKDGVIAEMDGVWRTYARGADDLPEGVALGQYETKELAAAALEQDDSAQAETEVDTPIETQAQTPQIDTSAEAMAGRVSDVIQMRQEQAKEMTQRGPVRRLGDVLQGTLHSTFTSMCDSWYIEGLYTREDRIKMSGAIGRALDIIQADIPQHIAQIELAPPEPFFFMGDDPVSATKAGRVLSGRNAAKIEAAILTLIEVLEGAGINLPTLGDEAAEADAADKAAGNETGNEAAGRKPQPADDTPPDGEVDRPEGTGGDDHTPILRPSDLALLDLEIEELGLMEV